MPRTPAAASHDARNSGGLHDRPLGTDLTLPALAWVEDVGPSTDSSHLSLVELVLALGQVRYIRRGRTHARLPTSELALTERALLVELRHRGVVFSADPHAPPTAHLPGLG